MEVFGDSNIFLYNLISSLFVSCAAFLGLQKINCHLSFVFKSGLPAAQFKHLFPANIWIVLGVAFALFSLFPSLFFWILVSRHLPLEDCVDQCLCHDLLHAKCRVVSASVCDQGNQLFGHLPAVLVPLQLSKRRLCRDHVGHLVQ